tara:strand:+ start:63556 stop:65211 length:1656 start_codon:yes stop_codon:yes gene_type:complete
MIHSKSDFEYMDVMTAFVNWGAYLLTILFTVLALTISPLYFIGLSIAGPLALLSIRDRLQTKHSILRNYPIMGHLRFAFESIRPEIMQYFVETDTDGRPFSRNERTVVYERAKSLLDDKPFGTELNAYSTEYEWLNHSIAPHAKATLPADGTSDPFRLDIGGPQCSKPYSSSIYNISAMSFGALSGNAIMALNKGAKKGGFYHDTGEGSISPYHRKYGGDLVWELGSGYFGCRTEDGEFDQARFAEQAVDDQVKMIEIKVSQGAKAGHGGVLPAAKISKEIAETRGIPMGKDCISPAFHKAFGTPIEMMHFIEMLRTESGGKPVGFKLCIGRPSEFMGICKAILETDILPDFIVIDGGEGGTGAGPIEFLDHMGTPLTEGLLFAHNVLVGTGLRDKIRIGCSAKIVTAFGIASKMATGADWCNAARGFMFAVGCIQAQRCQTNTCPVGVATQDPKRQKAIVVSDKAERVYNFHRNTLDALSQVVAAAGLDHPNQFEPIHISRRVSPTNVLSYEDLYDYLEPNELLEGSDNALYRKYWERATADAFCGPVAV